MYESIAELYAEHNLILVPIHQGKRCLLPGWSDLKEPLEPLLFEGASGIGILTGPINNIVCLDIDIEDSESEILLELTEVLLPPFQFGVLGNPKRKPARFFKYNNEPNLKLSFGVDLLSRGSYKIIPPTPHILGTDYEWVGGDLISWLDNLPALPPLVVEYLTRKKSDSKVKQNKHHFVNTDVRCMHGSHTELSKALLAMLYRDKPDDYIISELLKIDGKINKNISYFECPSRLEFKNKTKDEAMRWFIADARGRHSIYYSEDKRFDFALKNRFVENEQINFEEFYEYLNSTYHMKYLVESKSFAVWNGMHYFFESDMEFIKRMRDLLFDCVMIPKRPLFERFVKDLKEKTTASIKDFTPYYEKKINFLNGLFCIETNKLLPSDPKHLITTTIPYRWVDEDNTTPLWDELMSNVFLGRLDLQDTLEFMIGFALSGDAYTTFNYIFVFHGAGMNGKSTVLNIVKNLFGKRVHGQYQNTSSVSIETLGQNRFAFSNLSNSYLNESPEASKKIFSDVSPIKQLSGNDSVQVEEKHQKAFSAVLRCKHVITYNETPHLNDISYGMRRRLVILPFDQNFSERPDLIIKNVETRIIENEAEALIRRCVKRYQKALIERSITLPKASGDALNDLVVTASSVRSFVDEHYVPSDSFDDYVVLRDAYNDYCLWENTQKYTFSGFCRAFYSMRNARFSRLTQDRISVRLNRQRIARYIKKA